MALAEEEERTKEQHMVEERKHQRSIDDERREVQLRIEEERKGERTGSY